MCFIILPLFFLFVVLLVVPLLGSLVLLLLLPMSFLWVPHFPNHKYLGPHNNYYYSRVVSYLNFKIKERRHEHENTDGVQPSGSTIDDVAAKLTAASYPLHKEID